MYRKKTVLWLLFFLLFFTLEIEAKRSFSIRTRSKSSGTQYNSRRKSNRDGGSDGIGGPSSMGGSVNTGSSSSLGSNSHSAPSGSSSHSVGGSVHSDHSLTNAGRLEREAVIGKQTSGINSKALAPDNGPANQRPVGWDVNNNHNNKPSAGAPPPYPGLGGGSPTFNNPHPPSYYQSMGNPPTYAASQAHYGVGNTYGYPNSGTHGLGSSTLNGAGYSGYTGPSMVGGLSNQYPNNHGGIGSGGFNNGMGGYGSNYGYQKPSLFSTGNILTGLATWQVARALTPSRRNTHVQNNYYVNNGTDPVVDHTQPPIPISNTPIPSEGGLALPMQSTKLLVPVH